MSTAPGPEAVVPPVLAPNERRVLGVMVEKQKTTPDGYPLSLNALLTGCNQKSNRDPVLDLSDLDVEEALTSCQKRGLAIKITGSRVDRWRHSLYDTWRVDKVELAVLAELLLRGPQTEGELRGRVSRMEPVEELDALRAILRKLADRKFVVYLTPEGRRGTTVTHGFCDARELERLKNTVGQTADTGELPPPREPRAPARDDRLEQVLAEVALLRMQLEKLSGQVMELTGRVGALESPARS
jgi:uncharacterized protein YceH (UPF0502 family)